MLHRTIRFCFAVPSFLFLAGTLFLSHLEAATNSAWYARAWYTEDGLPEHTIVGLEQTSDGFLWIATHRELCRFDGLHFQEFAPAMSAAANAQIRAMLLDKKGRLWLAKDNGAVVCVADGRVAEVFTLNNVLPGAQPRSIAEDADGNIWVGDTLGSVFRLRDGQSQSFGTIAGTSGVPCWLAADKRGQIYFTGSKIAGVYRDGKFVVLAKLSVPAGRIAGARRGGVWLGVGADLFHLNEQGVLVKKAELPVPAGRTEAPVTALFEDRANAVWIGTSSSGLFRFDGQNVERISASHPSIVSVTEDSESNIWVGTRGGGLNRLNPRAMQLIGLSSGLPFAAVQSSCEDGSGTLWVTGQDGGLAQKRDGVWNLFSSNSGWIGSAICVVAEPRGGVLIGTRDKGVFRYNGGFFTPLPQNKNLPNLSVRSLYLCRNGDLWIAINSGVARIRANDGALKQFPLPSGASDVRAIIEGTNGDVWMGTTSDGLLLRARGDELINETISILKEPRHIRCFQVTSDGALWMGFAGQGLGLWKNGKYFQFRSAHGLWDEYISHILADQLGRLWMAGNRGIFQISPSELEAVATGRATRLRSVVFGRDEGVPNLQASFGVCPAAVPTRDGRLLIPMLTGLAVIEPNLLRRNSLPLPVIIERMMVNGKIAASYDSAGPSGLKDSHTFVRPRTSSEPLRLNPGVNALEFEFTGLSLVAPENVTFRYQLVGLDQSWVEAGGDRVARYPHITPGAYTFRVTACNHDGFWNETGASLAFVVTPHLWEATWFRVTGIFSAASLLGCAVLLVTRRRFRLKLERLEYQKTLERERARIAQDLHDDLGAGLVEISFGSELAQDPTLAPDEAREHTREIGVRAREMVTALDEIVWAVNPKHDDVSSLTTYFCQYAQHFLKTTSVRCHLDVARDLPFAPLNAEQRHNLFLAFKEALSNLVQHSGANDLRLAIAVQNETLIITLSDNGRGFDLNARNENGADGLGNMRRRLENLGGRCDLAGGVGQGVTITFRVPLRDISIPAIGRA